MGGRVRRQRCGIARRCTALTDGAVHGRARAPSGILGARASVGARTLHSRGIGEKFGVSALADL